MKGLLVTAIALLAAGCATTSDLKRADSESGAESRYGNLLYEGMNSLSTHGPTNAIQKYFDPIIQYFEDAYGDDEQREYCARTTTESLLYLMQAAADNKSAIVISQLWAEAYYLKGYASLDLGRIDDAKIWVGKALELSPSNAVYLSELGHIYQLEQNWTDALGAYTKAEESAKAFSPDESKESELLRAMRGIGYTLIEMQQIDEAEEKFRACLKIDTQNKKCIEELAYIEKRRVDDSPSK